MTADPQKPLDIPKKAFAKNLGMVRILSYDKNGFFFVVDAKDAVRYLHRDRLSFRK